MNEPMRPRTLVTGGAGCLGSPVCTALLDRGHDVLVLGQWAGEASVPPHLEGHSTTELTRRAADAFDASNPAAR